MRIAWLYGCEFIIDPWFTAIFAVAVLGGYLAEAVILLGALLTHELAHLLIGRGFGLEFSSIRLMPYGGVARIDNLYTVSPAAVAVTALAGPLNNLLLFTAAYLLVQVGWLHPPLSDFMLRVNLGLALFNLIPALPLDGGRLLQSWLRNRIGELAAHKYLIRLGYLVAGGMLLGTLTAALFGLWLLAVPVLAFFVAVGARSEQVAASFGHLRRIWQRPQEIAAKRILPATTLVVTRDVTVGKLLPHLVGQRYYLICVLDADLSLCGHISEAEIIRVALDGGLNLTLGEIVG